MNKIVTVLFSGFVVCASCVAADEVVKHRISGAVMWDADYQDGDFPERSEGTRSELRQARLGLGSRYSSNWSSKFKIDYNESDDNVSVLDAYLRYKWKDYALTLGKQKESFGLEYLTSSSELPLIERSAVSTMMSPGRNVGFNILSAKKKSTWSLGIYQDDSYDDSDGENKDVYALTGRATWRAFKTKQDLVHLGSAFSVRKLNKARFDIQSDGEIHTSDDIIDTKKIRADYINQGSIELGWQHNKLTLTSEYIVQDVQASVSTKDALYKGGYVQAGYFLSDAKRTYDKGIFDGIKHTGSRSAWELVSRYSYLDAEDNDKGAQLDNMAVGINYYYGDVKVMLDVIRSLKESESDEIDAASNGASLRLQYSF